MSRFDITSRYPAVASWLDRPLSAWWCALGWCVATAVFVGLVTLLGGLGAIDTYESVFSSWAIAHGQLACAFPTGFNVIAPLYPFLSGGIVAIEHVGNTVPFPPRASMGAHCGLAFTTINQWSLKAHVLDSTVKIGYVGWLFLMAGVIAWLRVTGRGRCRWEPITLILVACLPPVWLCVEGTFHPQDLMAMGFALAALACANRGFWVGAGILIALAFLSQQFAVLVAAPLLILSPGTKKLSYLGGAIGVVALATIPLASAGGSGSLHVVAVGTGNSGGIGGTLLWELGLHGNARLVLSRIVPLALSLVIAWWALRRLGPAAREPVAMIALVGVSLGLRLVFEQQLFGYYYMALSVALVMLDVTRGRIRASLAAWLATVSMVYLLNSDALELLRPPWLTAARGLIPVSIILLAVVLSAHVVHRRRASWMLGLYIAMIAAALLSWNETDILGTPPVWFWQVFLVPLGIMLAAQPLVAQIRTRQSLSFRPRPSSAPVP